MHVAGCRVWLIMTTKASTGRKRTNERTKKTTLRQRMSQRLAATTAVMYVARRVSNLVYAQSTSTVMELTGRRFAECIAIIKPLCIADELLFSPRSSAHLVN